MEDTLVKELIAAAIEARENAYAPFSHFAVGAALLTPEGRIFSGCNVECSGYSSTCCAERTAVCKAVSEGCRQFTAVAIVGGAAGRPISQRCAPCGVCRQVLAEFSDLDSFQVILADAPDRWERYSLAALLPLAFREDK